ncbi:MAG: FAD-dependent oxidoreductase, partial [Ignavibacteriaceae bacterium]|nr:FAD-dependent oxidoreductase [Ignavibacteriaceae bacterium]
IYDIRELEDKNSIVEVKLNKCTSVFDEKGIFAPIYEESITNKISGDEVIVCIGQEADVELIDDKNYNSFFSNGIIEVNMDTLETKNKGIFAGGDIVSGPASVIDAVGHGRKAARSIDKFLGGDGIINYDEDLYNNNEMFIGREEGFGTLKREQVSYVDADERKINFNPFELTYEKDSAIKEGSRCLRCDLRLHFRHNPSPPEKYLRFNVENIEMVPSEEGVIQLLDDNKEVYHIKGTDNMKETLLEILNDNGKTAYFIYEADPMFTKRESELLQQYLQKHGKLPDSGDDLDDLF